MNHIENMESFSCTRRDIVTFSHNWHIENFDLSKTWSEIVGFKSNQFAAPGDSNEQFYIELKQGNYKDGYYGLWLELNRVNPKAYSKFKCLFDIRIGNIAISKEADCACHIFYNDLYKEPNKISSSDTLKMRCEVTIFNAPATNNKQLLLNVPKPNILNDLSALLHSEEFADVKIVTGDGKEIPAHKLILSARSKVFGAMFKHPLEENQQNCVNISDYSYEVVLEMLRFIYTGCAPNLKDMTEELLSAADKYDLGRLKAMCLNFLAGNLGVENAATTLKLADLYHVEELKSYVVAYIKGTSEVFKTPGWKSLVKNDLNLILDLFLAFKLDEEK